MSLEHAMQQRLVETEAACRLMQDKNLRLQTELNNHRKFVEEVKAMIPANYPYRSSCSSPFCKMITALRARNLE